MNEIGEHHLSIISKSSQDLEAVKKALEGSGLEFTQGEIISLYGIPVYQNKARGIL